jgi:hypothetical protein
MKSDFRLKITALFTLFLLSYSASAFEMQGMISYNLGQINPKPTNYLSSSNGIGYTFLGRLDLGPGQIESGFQFVPTSISTTQTFGELKATGSYWILPLMYRYTFLPPFFSIAIGGDYAVVGTNNLSVGGAQVNGLTSGYRSHFGAQVSFEINQDLGEDLSIVLDLRYRAGLANAITYGTEGSKYNFWVIGLGIQKHLELDSAENSSTLDPSH